MHDRRQIEARHARGIGRPALRELVRDEPRRSRRIAGFEGRLGGGRRLDARIVAGLRGLDERERDDGGCEMHRAYLEYRARAVV